jgi:hypothetical protein
VLLGVAANSLVIASDPSALRIDSVEAQFRGCDAAGWCRFRVGNDAAPEVIHRVRPDGITRPAADTIEAVEVRDRLNTLLSSMIHQHKRIVLRDLRGLGDGTYAATVIVNEADVAEDEILKGRTED